MCEEHQESAQEKGWKVAYRRVKVQMFHHYDSVLETRYLTPFCSPYTGRPVDRLIAGIRGILHQLTYIVK